MSESVPTSISAMSHRRSRADSTASFTYFPDEPEDQRDVRQWSDEDAVVDDEVLGDYEEDLDLEAANSDSLHRISSAISRNSVHDRLLRSDSARTENSAYGHGGRTSQKIYIVTEDLTIVVAGFKTRPLGFIIYITLCVLTAGLGYLLFRWLPRWHVRLIGSPCPLRDCTWVVIEVCISWFILRAELIVFFIESMGRVHSPEC